MKQFSIDNIRNVALVGHQSSGKTTMAEAIIYNAGVINRLGKIEDGNTVLDHSPDEIQRKISISSGLAFCEIDKTKINLLDTPGYADFLGEVMSCLPVVEGALIVMSADSGVEAGTERAWGHLEKCGIARIVCVNKMDKEHADFDKCVAEAQKHLGARVIPLHLPVIDGGSFKGIVDVVKRRAFLNSTGTEGKFTEGDVPEALEGKTEELRKKLMDFAAETDDSLLEKFLEGGELTDEELSGGLAAGCRAGTLVPLLAASAAGNIGVKQIMELMVSMLPSPADRSEAEVKEPVSGKTKMIKVGPDSSTLSFVYKSMSEKHTGDLSFIKVFSGRVGVGGDLYNSNLEVQERIGQLYFIQGKNRLETDAVCAGDIGAAVKLKYSKVNHTLCSRSDPVLFPPVEFPEPTLHTAISPKVKGDEERVGTGLNKLNEEDPTFAVRIDPELRQTILSGQGELHLEVVLSKLKRKYGVEVNMIPPKIPYRETIITAAEAQGKYKRQSGGRGQYGDVWLKLEPLPSGTGFEFVNAIVGGVIPSKYIPAVEKGVISAMGEGVIAGYPMMDVRVTLYDGTHHQVDSSDNAFKIAGSLGFKSAAKGAKPVILEPIMNVSVLVPEDYMGDVMGDLSARRGKIQGMEQEGNLHKIKAQVPLAELHRYSTSLRSLTQGRGTHRREFSHYEEVPHDIAGKLIAEVEAAREEGK